jgi:hypothetical protein
MRGCRNLFGFISLIVFGMIFVSVGIGIGVFGSRAANAAADRAEQLPPMSAAGIEDSVPGRTVLVEGRISARNPTRFRDFVAYVREEYRGEDDDGDSEWREDERVTPPLLIEVARNVVAIGNDTYRLDTASQHWQESSTLRWNSFTGEGTKRYQGFAANDIVMLIGVVAPGQEGQVVHAEFIYGGARADYITSQRNTAKILPWFGLVFAGIGGVILSIGGIKLLRRIVWRY